MVQLEDYPINLQLLKLDTPRILSGEEKMQTNYYMRFFSPWKHDVLERKYSLIKPWLSSLYAMAQCRVLAKIAHSFAVAKLGLAGFIPMLPAFILGKNDRNFYYVGGTLDKSGAGTELHELGFEVDESNYLVVRIRLFSSLGAPVFRVVVGTKNSPV
jgi:hypothetical protein